MPIFSLIRRGLLSLMLVVSLAVVPTTAPVVAQSSENTRYAAIVVDAETGEVLFARHADAQRFPASVTKIMTLYLTFEALAEGEVKLDDVITVSSLAASQPPSKLGLAAGQTITLDDAMKATAVRSANDMAMAIAEHVGGSQDAFAVRATRKARELGMTRTNYVNPNGLPDDRQITTARDLAVLSRAVMRDYPQYYRYFGLHDWTYQGRLYRNTNGLLLGGNGYDGMKTGYIRASGYNLVASAVRDGRRLITVVLGGQKVASRNAHVAQLMDTGFEVERLRRAGQPIQIAQTFFEQRGFGIGSDNSAPVQYASAADEAEEDGDSGSTAVSYASLPATPPQPERTVPAPSESRTVASLMRGGAPSDVTASLNGGGGSPARPTPPPPRPREPARAPAGRWAVQVGAFRDETVARDWLTEVNRRFRSQFTAAERTVQNAEGWYRSRFTGMSEQAAQAACATLAERRVTCMVIRPQ
ncbi:D-alanyl-D-alanine carboxypeptidase (penicillin-binding protein 5/6) [Brevundimonas alba]|uniref:D-alanyl-D-alanine carboxypeptidase (Penicillin-binding protein 5/6) n=1 Tax=Brevundimonas alba TaxID=74314 RepID=A0A7X5YQ26_9CAUL|nr:D-alanyl-D-alanine carboxypeptidase [Brevundimonas alba]NJC42625.1 D-alanyl-D-alanine carboxypeptidase (penicillin-binding protein 5/6) [Brevundimonas alba]